MFHRLLSYLPSQKGKSALEELIHALSHEGINFSVQQVSDENGVYFVAESTNVEKKYIVTSGRSLTELEKNIKDAIFTAFHVPARYADEKLIHVPTVASRQFEIRYAAA